MTAPPSGILEGRADAPAPGEGERVSDVRIEPPEDGREDGAALERTGDDPLARGFEAGVETALEPPQEGQSKPPPVADGVDE